MLGLLTRRLTSPLMKQPVRTHTKRVPRAVAKDSWMDSRVAGAIFVIAPISTFCLGVWQYRRRQWKFDLIADLDEKVRRAEPVPLNVTECEGIEYQRISARGKFDHSTEVLIGPRSLINPSGGSSGGGVISLGRAGDANKVGYHVISAFTLESGERVLVNRGWVPQSMGNASTRQEGQVVGEQEISGVLRVTEQTSSLTPKNREDNLIWFSRDVPALAKKLRTLPILFDLDLASSQEAAQMGGPVGGQTRISLTNDHAQYMFTWWAISAITTILWLQKFVL